MKTFFLLTALGAVAFAGAQGNSQTGSTAGMSSTTRMSDMAISQAMTALKAGKKVTITVDNRTVGFTPRLMGKMVYIPVRFFQETGQTIVWDKGDKRAQVTDQAGTQKNSVQFDASVSQMNRQPGPSMRPMYTNGTLYVPLESGLASFGLLAQWVPTSNRINVKTARPATGS